MQGTIGTFLPLRARLRARSFRRSIRCTSTKMARSINSLSTCVPSRWPRSLRKPSFKDFSLRGRKQAMLTTRRAESICFLPASSVLLEPSQELGLERSSVAMQHQDVSRPGEDECGDRRARQVEGGLCRLARGKPGRVLLAEGHQ